MSLNGKLIVIEGTDGSGKQTQTAMLKERLEKLGYDVKSFSFPNYDSESSRIVKMYLNGEIAQKADQVSAKAASVFFAVDRYITYKKQMEKVYSEGNSVILLDRYVGSNIIHQGSKIIQQISSKEEQEKQLVEFIKWLDNFEHNDLDLPRADVTLFLNVPIEITEKLREGRLNKSNQKKKQDIHEADITHLRNSSLSGNMAAKILCLDVIECVKDGQMLPVNVISDKILQTVESKV